MNDEMITRQRSDHNDISLKKFRSREKNDMISIRCQSRHSIIIRVPVFIINTGRKRVTCGGDVLSMWSSKPSE